MLVTALLARGRLAAAAAAAARPLAPDDRAPLRRPALDALAQLLPRARARARRLRRRCSRRGRLWLLVAAAAVVVVGLAFVKAYPHIGPKTSFTPDGDRRAGQARARARGAARPSAATVSRTRAPRATGGACSRGSRPSSATRRATAPATPARPRRGRTCAIQAGESTYTELGVDAGLAGGLLFVAWSLALLWRLARCSAWI